MAQSNNSGLNENWVILILPQLEQQNLFASFNLTQPIPNPVNAAPRSIQLAAMLCPSDTYNRLPFNGSASGLTSSMGDNWARGDYAANASLGYMGSGGTVGTDSGWANRYLRGVMGANTSERIDDIHDGTSDTILVGEIRAGIIRQDTRGVWAMSGACPSALWCHGYLSDSKGPNSTDVNGDDPRTCSEIQASVGGATELIKWGMSCYSGNNQDVQQGARSMHDGGVNICFADGSVHWIGDYVDHAGANGSPPTLSVWDRLNLSNDSMPIDATAY